MLDPIFPFVAVIGVFALTFRSLAAGIIGIFIVGYFNGIIRANYLSVYTTFMFDAGLLGLYAGFLVSHHREAAQIFRSKAGYWAMLLIGWPALLSLIPINDFMVQLVALRATVWFLPVMLIATRLQANDLAMIARGLVGLNLFALAGGIYVFQYGVATLYPENPVTQIIHNSKDVAGMEHHRIPSIFLSAHSYGGAMLFSLPFLLDRTFGRQVKIGDRVAAAVGVASAFVGILLCAARVPVVMFAIAAIVAWGVSRFHMGIGIVTISLIVICMIVAGTSDRLQRAASLDDSEYVSDRVRVSANASFFDLMLDYPAGAGMGSSAGTSIPYFLADRAPRAIGLENEYCRILIDEGWVGLGLWITFLVWLHCRPPPQRLDCPWGYGILFMFSLVLTNWVTAFIGTGTLSSTPGSVLLLTQMGILIRVREITDRDSA